MPRNHVAIGAGAFSGALSADFQALGAGAFSASGQAQRVAPPANSTAFDWYIDSINGSDAADGQSPGTALRSIGAIPEIADYDRVGLAAGSYFEEMLDLSGTTGVLVGAYNYVRGVTPMPRIDTRKTLVNEDFEAEGTANVWQIELEHEITSANSFTRVFVDGVPLTFQTSIANVSANAGSCHYAGTASGNNPLMLYVHPPGSTDPTGDGKHYQAPARDYAIKVGAKTIVRDIWCEAACHVDGLIAFTSAPALGGTLDCCVFRWMNKHASVLQPEAGFDVLFKGTIGWGQIQTATQWGGGAVAFTGYEDAPAGGNITFDGIVVMGNDASASTKPAGAITHTGGSGAFGHVKLTGGYFLETTNPIQLGSWTTHEIADCLVDNASSQVMNISGTVNLSGITAINMPANYRFATMLAAGSTLNLTDCCLEDDGNAGGGVIWGNTTIEYTVNLDHCSFQGGTSMLFSDDADTRASIEDCIFDGVTMINLEHAQPVTAADRNVYFRSGSNPSFTTENVSKSGLAAWQSHSGLDANSVQADPLWAGTLGEGDFSLQANSPAFTGGRNAGARKWRTRPDWAAITAKLATYVYCHPTDAVGGSELVVR